MPGRKYPPNVEELVGVLNSLARTVLPNLDTRNDADVKSISDDLTALNAELFSKLHDPQNQVGNQDQGGNQDQDGNEDQDGNQDQDGNKDQGGNQNIFYV